MAVFRPGLFLGGPMSLRALLYRRPSEPSTIQVVFDRSIYLVRIRRHRQARRYTLRIDAASREVVLTMPPRGSIKEAKDFAQKHGGWIAARLKRLPEAAPFAHGAEVPLRGVTHRIVHRRGARGTVWTETDGYGERLFCVAGEPPHVDRRISDYLKREAARDLAAASRRYADELGVAVERVAVRDQSSRWGSCSNTGVLSFSLCARLPGGARGRASGRAQSFAAVLAPGREALPEPRARQGLARRQRHRPAPLRARRPPSRRRPPLTPPSPGFALR